MPKLVEGERSFQDAADKGRDFRLLRCPGAGDIEALDGVVGEEFA